MTGHDAKGTLFGVHGWLQGRKQADKASFTDVLKWRCEVMRAMLGYRG